jgi:hypothetical protein
VNGNIGANDAGAHLNLGKGIFMPDNTSAQADSLRVGTGSNVYSVFSNTLFMGPLAIIRGPTGPATLPLTNPFCPVPTFTCGGPDVIVESDASSGPLPPGSYGNVIVRNGASLTLDPGTFDICKLQVGRGGVVEPHGPVTIDVVGTVLIANEAHLVGVPPAPPVSITLNVLGKSVRVGQNSVVQAFVSAPNAQFRLGRSSLFQGSFCVDTLRNDKHITLECPCGTP